VASGLDTLHISLDAATPATYERIRVRAHWDRAERGLAAIWQGDEYQAFRAQLASDTPPSCAAPARCTRVRSDRPNPSSPP
jgi:hypothetical protein